MWIILIFLAVGIIGACVWSLVKCFTGKRTAVEPKSNRELKLRGYLLPLEA